MGINVYIFETKLCLLGLIFSVSSGLVISRYMNYVFVGIYFCNLKVVAEIAK